VSRFAYTYEDPEYEISEELLDEQEQEVEDEEIYSPYYGA
jgi:poly-beta-hydroxyalkanoate depolymerase